MVSLEEQHSLAIEHLLSQVSSVQARQKELDQVTGQGFNVFAMLGGQGVRLHSTFMASLLDPKGSHGQADAFLKLFLQQIGLPGHSTRQVRIELEERSLHPQDHNPVGGQLDIIIHPGAGGGPVLVVENRLHGQNQRTQLRRYHNRFGRRCQVFYLTPQGQAPAVHEDDAGLPIKATALGYQPQVLAWLEDCKKECVNHFLLLSTISQYINLVKEAIGQSGQRQMENQVLNLLRNASNYSSARLIKAQFEQFHRYQQQAFFEQLQALAPTAFELKMEYEFGDRLGRCIFIPTGWKVAAIDLREYDGELLFGLYNRHRWERLSSLSLHQLSRLPGVDVLPTYMPERPDQPYIWHPYFPNAEITDETIVNLHTGDLARQVIDTVTEIFYKLEDVTGL